MTTTTARAGERIRTTSIWCLLDRSGSMQSIRNDVVGGFDAFLASQVDRRDHTVVTVAQFDTQAPYDVIANRLPVNRVRSIGDRFRPRGGTPLYDAIGSLLDHAEHRGRGEDRLIVIVTDGLENASQRWTRRALFHRINRLRERGWTFVFIGANQDSYATGRSLGFAPGSVSNFAGDPAGTRAACESLTRATREWRAKSPTARRHEEAEFFGGRKEAEDDLRHVHATPVRQPDRKWWATGTACADHGVPWCPSCEPKEPDVIIVTGGSAYHRVSNCQALIDGQRSVERRGGQPSPLQTVRLSTAKSRSRSACLVCQPQG